MLAMANKVKYLCASKELLFGVPSRVTGLE